MKPNRTNLPLLVVVLIAAVALSFFSRQRIRIDSDIVSSVPHDDPVINDAMHLLTNLPLQDQLTIDVGLDHQNPDVLVECGRAVEEELRKSGLFKSVGMDSVSKGLPQLVETVSKRLPVLFTGTDLAKQVKPLLTPEAISLRMQAVHNRLLQMDGIGEASGLSVDPLGLKNLILKRLQFLAPTSNARIYQGHLISADGRHLLVTAVPFGSGTDTALARRLKQTVEQVSESVRRSFGPRGIRVRLTPVGAYRAALDNEVIVRRDVQRALWLTTLGVALLLLLSFPRPLIGLLSLLPAMVGAVAALFVMTFIYRSISVMVLGFGGAIISITVDHGVAYFLFMDRPHGSLGSEAAKEMRAASLVATLTTIGAFGALIFSGFPILSQLGVFAALGHFFSFLFIQLIFPRVFPSLQSDVECVRPLPRVAERLFSFGSKGAFAALVLFVVMMCFARPDFNVNMSKMNTVSRSTQAAEHKMMTVWGNVFGKVYVMSEAPSLEALQAKDDQLLSKLKTDPNPAILKKAFSPSMVFPGPRTCADNLASWKAFWNPQRIAKVRASILKAASETGFTANAFDPFFNLLAGPKEGNAYEPIPAEDFTLLGISAGKRATPWREVTSLVLPSGYSGKQFYARYSSLAGIFDPVYFSHRLGRMVSTQFVKLLITITPIVVLIIFFAFLNLYLTFVSLVPVLFAMTCTLGTLRLLGLPLDLPALVPTIVILGEGVELSLYIVTSYQRYRRASHPYFSLIRTSVLVNSGSTMIAFGVLAFSQHTLLKSAGITSLLAISYSALGTFLLLPPLLKQVFEKPAQAVQSEDIRKRVLDRYHLMEAFPRMFARFKSRLDPMFAELPSLLPFNFFPRILMDIGSGYGVPACWLAETYPGARIYGIEPQEERVRVASNALGLIGQVVQGGAPDLPPAPEGADGAFMLDMLHFLSDAELILTLERLNERLHAGALLAIRSVMVPERRMAFFWSIDQLRNRLHGIKTHYRSAEAIKALLKQCGYEVTTTAPSGTKGDLLWIISLRIEPN
ncbi:MAG: MMPL family transporter [Syntrophobacteraceae bacterium]